MPTHRYYVLKEKAQGDEKYAVWVQVYPQPPKRAVKGLKFQTEFPAEQLSHALQAAFDQGVAHGQTITRRGPGSELTGGDRDEAARSRRARA